MAKSNWDKQSCGCIKADLPKAGRVIIHCWQHRTMAKGGRLACYFDANGIVVREGERSTKVAAEPEPIPEIGEFVYFARIGDSIKVGYSTNPQQRADQFGAELIGFIPGDRELEKQLHHQLRKYRLRKEWYRDSPKLQKIIRKVLAAG